MNRGRLILYILACLLAAFRSPGAERLYEHIVEIRHLTPEEAAEGRAVELEAQVMRVNPHDASLFLYDGTFGIFVSQAPGAKVERELKTGDIVHLKGVTCAGSFMPSIIASEIKVVGHRPRPVPERMFDIDIVDTNNDCKWGLVVGRLLSMSISPDRKSIFLKLNRVDAVEIQAQLPYSEENERRIRELMFRFVKFGALCGTVANENRQMIGRVFYADSAADFELAGSEWQSNIEGQAEIHELMRYNVSFNRPVRTHGVVLYAGEREMYLRGERACLKVVLPEPVAAEPGDQVSVSGFIWRQPVSPAFRAEKVVVEGQGAVPVPVKLVPSEKLDPLLNYDLVEVEAELVGLKTDYPEGGVIHTLRCRNAGAYFEVQLPGGVSLDERLEPGAWLHLTGICTMQRDPEQTLELVVSGFRLLLRGAEDVRILRPAPWWTPARLFWFAGGTLVIAAGFLLWIVLLRKTVERQTRIIGEKVEREAMLNERQRIARELHDNLEQGLAGAIFQLGGLRRILSKNGTVDRPGLEQLAAVERMLKHCSTESRSSILDLRGGLLEKMDLVEAVKVTVRALEEEYESKVDLCVAGEPTRFAPAAERNLLLVVKEAVSNAVRHAAAHRISVEFVFSHGLKITVADDGCGFNVDEKLNAGRFGLKGMHERMQQVNGSLEVISSPGKGTRIVARVAATEAGSVNDGKTD